MNSTALAHRRELGHAEGTLLKLTGKSARFGLFLKTHYFTLRTKKTLGKSTAQVQSRHGLYKARSPQRMNDN